MKERTEITEMPDKKTLEQFVSQIHGEDVKVIFNLETGKFEWIRPREGEPPARDKFYPY